VAFIITWIVTLIVDHALLDARLACLDTMGLVIRAIRDPESMTNTISALAHAPALKEEPK
jgi:hypothetical protein